MSTLAHNRKNTTQTGTFTPTPGRVLQRTCACGQHTDGGECAECRQKGEGMLQRAGMNPVAVNSAPPIVHDEEEIRSANAHKWSPSSVDFQATATNSGGGSGADTFQSLLSQIESKPLNSISNLGLIGHANSSMFGLSGTIIPGDVVFKPEGVIGAEAIAKNIASIVKVRDRFTTSAKITLYGCDAGLGKGLLDALSNAFRVCVRGFTNEINWCFTFAGKKINAGSRGRVFVDTAGLLASNLPSCDDFLKDVKQLRPDNESCVGVTATPNPKGAAVEAPDDNALAGLEEADSGRANEEAAQVSQGDSTEQANEGVSSENVA